MSISLTINGTSYAYPEQGDSNWGTEATDWASAVTSGMLQKAGGLFQLLAETDFGPNYGLKSIYFKSRTSNPADAGQLRLARADVVSWRNQANSANLDLSVDASDQLLFNGVAVGNFVSVSDTATIDLTLAAGVLSADIKAASIDNSMIATAAAIALTKLAATTVNRAIVSDSSGFLVPATTTATEIGYVNGVTSSIQTQLNAKQATITGAASSIVSADLTLSRAIVSDGSGKVAAATTTATEIGYVNGVTSGIQTQLDSKIPKSLVTAKGDIIAASGSATPVAVPVTVDGDVLTVDAASAGGVKFAAPSASPTQSYEISNLGLATSVAASALTIAIKQADGSSDPSAGASAVKVGMRSSTLTSGAYNQRSITSALSLVISSGSTLGQVSTKPANIYVYLIDNAGTLEVAASGTKYPEMGVISTTAEGGAGAADSSSVVYSTTARTNVPYRLIGVITNTQTTAGTWASAGTVLGVGNFANLRASLVPTIQKFTSGSGTYYTPAGVTYLRVRMVGGGGGGCGSGSASLGNGGNGGASTFGSQLSAGGGNGANNSLNGGIGGTATLGASGLTGIALTGGGGCAAGASTTSVLCGSGAGGNSAFGGGGAGMMGYFTGISGAANTGGGGAGGGANTSQYAGSGGGAGGFIDVIIPNPVSSYSYAVGAGGTAGNSGTGGATAGAGGAGLIEVTEFYQ